MVAILALALTVPLLTAVQPAPTVLRGIWIATSGQEDAFRGSWSATLQGKTSNGAEGSWTLLDNANRVVLQGTWSARKSPTGRHGTWAARIVTGSAHGRASRGRSFAGTWRADIEKGAAASLTEMLERALQRQISGTWRSARLQGHWWLKGPPD